MSSILSRGGGANATLVIARGATTSRTLSDRVGDALSPRDFGAVGDGAADDTAAIQLALNSGRNVRGTPGDTYLVNGGLASAAAGQVIDFSGCTVTLKTAAASHGILVLNGIGARCVGGTWDLNVAGNATGDPYGYYAVLLNADRTVAENMYVRNSFGIGVKGAAGKNYLEARFNRVENTALVGIYFDGSATVDSIGNSIHHNKVDVSANLSGLGIYIASASPFTFVHRRWRIQDNEVLGPTAGATAASVAITARGQDGIVSGNHVLGTNIGISVDISAGDESTVVSWNRVEGINGPFAGGIEVNGARVLVEGNVIKGGRYGITGSSTGAPSSSMDYQQHIGNQLVDQTVYGIYEVPGAGHTAQHLNIHGNTIVSGTAMNGFVRLNGDCRFSIISGNLFKGPGSAVVGGRGVFLDTVLSNVTIRGNKFAGLERPVALYDNTSIAYDHVSFEDNDVSEDMTTNPLFYLNFEGTAAISGGLRVINNFTGDQNIIRNDIEDLLLNVRRYVGNTWVTPEGNLVAGIGSTYTKTGGATPILYVKESGAGATGWIGK